MLVIHEGRARANFPDAFAPIEDEFDPESEAD
jgi:hypothetical protein